MPIDPRATPIAPSAAPIDRTAPRNFDSMLAGSGLPRHEARALLEAASGRRREWLIAHGSDPVDPAVAASFGTLAARRRAGEPLAYLVGWREFHGRRFEVDASVLIPRDDTEVLVEQALLHAPAGCRVLDLGTGSGIVAITLACERPDLNLIATDQSREALAIAARNAARLGVGERIEFRLADSADSWWSALRPEECFGLIVSNPPYVADGDTHLHQGDLRHEPPAALTDGSADGLLSIERICRGVSPYLDAGGWLIIEHGFDQGPAVRALFGQAGLSAVATIRDPAGHERVAIGRVQPSSSDASGNPPLARPR